MFVAAWSTPQSFPAVSHYFGPYFAFELNWAFLMALSYWIYYTVLEPVAGVSTTHI